MIRPIFALILRFSVEALTLFFVNGHAKFRHSMIQLHQFACYSVSRLSNAWKSLFYHPSRSDLTGKPLKMQLNFQIDLNKLGWGHWLLKNENLISVNWFNQTKPQMPQTQREYLNEISQFVQFSRRFYLSNLVESINRFRLDRFN